MKQFFVILVLCLLSIAAIQAQDTVITWELISEEPISPHGASGSWNSSFNEPGAVIYHDGQYHLFVTGYSGGINRNGIGYRISDDGVHYEWFSEDPIIRSEDLPNSPLAIAANDVLILEDGTWVLYYFNFNSRAWPRIEATIGRATAEAPEGPWTADADPVLVPGEDGSWDQESVAYASVTATDDGFVMYYSGMNERGLESIGRATSVDGIVWEKDPEPVYMMDLPDEGINFVVNEVIFDGERWIMAYKSQRRAIGIAISEDGIVWERYAENPIFEARDFEGFTDIGFISFLYTEEDGYTVFFEGNTGVPTQIYAARLTIP